MPFWSRRPSPMTEPEWAAAAREAREQADLLALLGEVFGPAPPPPELMRLARPRPLAPEPRNTRRQRTMRFATAS